MNHRCAVMDLGTNTFHLLIAENTPSGFKEILHVEEAVKLGEGGINKGYILPAPFERGLKTMQRFAGIIKQNQAKQVRAIATSALRNAANGGDFIREVKEGTGINIEMITGEQEAGFIYQGVKASGCLSAQKSLIADIGGGSVEFIICNNSEIFWKQSFEIGAARLMDKFHQTDPMTQEAIAGLQLYLEDCLPDLFTAATHHPVKNMIGSSGSFESYATLMAAAKGDLIDLKKIKSFAFEISGLMDLIAQISSSSHRQRMDNKAIIPVRKDMIVTASILVKFIIEELGIEKVTMTTYSLKEGALAGMMG